MLIFRNRNEFFQYTDAADRPEATVRGQWWCRYGWPLVPVIYTSRGNPYNCKDWSFEWLILRLWSVDHASFTLDAEISECSCHVGAVLPYLRISLLLPGLRVLANLRRLPPPPR